MTFALLTLAIPLIGMAQLALWLGAVVIVRSAPGRKKMPDLHQHSGHEDHGGKVVWIYQGRRG